MRIHLLSPSRLSERLASGDMEAREQASYLVAGAILWLFPGYLLIVPAPNLEAWSWTYGLWFYEFVLLVLFNVFGVFYCLVRCEVEPRRNFLIDFTCLSAPVSLTTLVVVWAVFHLYATAFPWWLIEFQAFADFEVLARWIELLYSSRFSDLMRFLAIVTATAVIFIRVGNHMQRISTMRQSANQAVQGTVASEARSGP